MFGWGSKKDTGDAGEVLALAHLQRQGLTPAREVELMDEALARLERKAEELAELTDYLRQKRDWAARGKPGDEPRFLEHCAEKWEPVFRKNNATTRQAIPDAKPVPTFAGRL